METEDKLHPPKLRLDCGFLFLNDDFKPKYTERRYFDRRKSLTEKVCKSCNVTIPMLETHYEEKYPRWLKIVGDNHYNAIILCGKCGVKINYEQSFVK